MPTMTTSDFLIVLLGIVSALVCVMLCAARFGMSRQAIIAEQQHVDQQIDSDDAGRRAA
jgi:hypothetical protein